MSFSFVCRLLRTLVMLERSEASRSITYQPCVKEILRFTQDDRYAVDFSLTCYPDSMALPMSPPKSDRYHFFITALNTNQMCLHIVGNTP